MKNQNLFNRLKQLEQRHDNSSKDEKFTRFLDSLPDEDKKKIACPEGPCLFFNGEAKEWERIISLYDGKIDTEKIIFIDDLTE